MCTNPKSALLVAGCLCEICLLCGDGVDDNEQCGVESMAIIQEGLFHLMDEFLCILVQWCECVISLYILHLDIVLWMHVEIGGVLQCGGSSMVKMHKCFVCKPSPRYVHFAIVIVPVNGKSKRF